MNEILPVTYQPVSLSERSATQIVWPIDTEAEATGLRRLASILGCYVEPEAKAVSVPRRQGLVVALDLSFRQLAKLYAALTGRTTALCVSAQRLAQLENVAVVLATPEHVTSKLLAELYQTAPKAMVPGLLIASSVRAMRRQVLTRSAALYFGGRCQHGVVWFRPAMEQNEHKLGKLHVVGGAVAPMRRRDLLTEGTELLMVETHSDGIDAFLGPGLTLCPMLQDGAGGDLGRAPVCCSTGRCFRHNVPIIELASRGLTVAPKALSARVLVMATCSAVLPEGKALNSRWGYALQLADNPAIGALLATWHFIRANSNSYRLLLHEISCGAPLGAAIASFHASRRAQVENLAFCLLGDPDLRLSSTHVNQKTSNRSLREVASRRLDDDRFQLLSAPPIVGVSERDEPAHKPPFLALYLRHAGKTCTAEAKEAWHKAVAAVFTYYATHRADRWKALVQMQEAVLAYIRARGAMIFHDWIGIGDTTRCAYRVSCPVCRTPAHADVVSFVAFGFEPRRLTTCPCCGIVEDAPLSNDLVLRRHGSRSFELLGTHPDRLWRGDLHLASKDRSLVALCRGQAFVEHHSALALKVRGREDWCSFLVY